jgi:thymidylate synthase
MRSFTCSSPSVAYQRLLNDLLYNPEFKSSPRGQQTHEVLDYTVQITSPSAGPIVTADADRNVVIADYTKAEFELYASKTRSVADFAVASTFWKKLANPDGTINSAYGYLIWGKKCCGDPNHEIEHFEPGRMSGERVMRTPWEWSKLMLENDPDTRQAILYFNTPDFAWVGTKDFPCTQDAQFLMREDRLYLTVKMRSNDVVKGWPYDVAWFQSLLFKMVDELKPRYPKLEVGTYTHNAGSMHLYERDFLTASNMIGEIAT